MKSTPGFERAQLDAANPIRLKIQIRFDIKQPFFIVAKQRNKFSSLASLKITAKSWQECTGGISASSSSPPFGTVPKGGELNKVIKTPGWRGRGVHQS